MLARGFASTVIDDVARDAGVSRATVYRLFPGGRAEVLDAFLRRELDIFFLDLYEQLHEVSDLETLLVEGLMYARTRIIDHPILNIALVEDSTVLETTFELTLASIERAMTTFFLAYLSDGPWRVERADFLARMALSYLGAPGTWDFRDRDQVAALVRCELLPDAGGGDHLHPSRPRPLPAVRTATLQQRVTRALQDAFVDGDPLSMENIARRADVSRATLYRAFPGGRWSLVTATVEIETARILAAVAADLSAAESLDEAVLATLTTAWHHATTHHALTRLLEIRPDLLHDQLRFDKAQRNFATYTSQLAPLLTRWVGREAATRVAEWTLRVMFSYWLEPSEAVDIGDPHSVADFYSHHLAAGVAALADLPDRRVGSPVLQRKS